MGITTTGRIRYPSACHCRMQRQARKYRCGPTSSPPRRLGLQQHVVQVFIVQILLRHSLNIRRGQLGGLVDERLAEIAGQAQHGIRGGNASDELITVVLMRDGAPMRYFPIGAKNAIHVALRVVEDLLGDTILELLVAAPEGCAGTVIVDLGLVEV